MPVFDSQRDLSAADDLTGDEERPEGAVTSERLSLTSLELPPGFESLRSSDIFPPSTTASNFQPGSQKTFYVHGLSSGLDNLISNSEILADLAGQEVSLIRNQGSLNPLGRIARSISRLSFSHVLEQDRAAVDAIKTSILEGVERGERTNIIAHSDGASLTRVALEELSLEEANGFQEILDNLKITSLGSDLDTWPRGLEVLELTANGDFVENLIALADNFKEQTNSGIEVEVNLNRGSRPHQLRDLVDAIPEALNQAYIQRGKPELLVDAIETGQWSDQVFNDLLGSLPKGGLNSQEQRFVQLLEQSAEAGLIGRYRLPEAVLEHFRGQPALTSNEMPQV